LNEIQEQTDLVIPQLYLGGGISSSDTTCQIQADIMGIPTVRLDFAETTARAAALLAGLGSGQWTSVDELPRLANGGSTFHPRLGYQEQNDYFDRWQKAIARISS
jgi:glycerol kinase